MQTLFYLSTCDTCKRIMKNLDLPNSIYLQDIKKEPITPDQLESMFTITGSYEKLFNKRAQLYRKRELNKKQLREEDYKDLLLEHYTFLKRPVLVDGTHIFIGNNKANIAELEKRYDDNSILNNFF